MTINGSRWQCGLLNQCRPGLGERAAPPESIGLVEAYHRRLNCGDPGVEMEAARAWARWEVDVFLC